MRIMIVCCVLALLGGCAVFDPNRAERYKVRADADQIVIDGTLRALNACFGDAVPRYSSSQDTAFAVAAAVSSGCFHESTAYQDATQRKCRTVTHFDRDSAAICSAAREAQKSQIEKLAVEAVVAYRASSKR